MCLSIPPKYSVSNTVGFLKGKSAVRIHRELQGQRRMTGLYFWATGSCVSAVGLDEETIRRYIREQDELQRRKCGRLTASPMTRKLGRRDEGRKRHDVPVSQCAGRAGCSIGR